MVILLFVDISQNLEIVGNQFIDQNILLDHSFIQEHQYSLDLYILNNVKSK